MTSENFNFQEKKMARVHYVSCKLCQKEYYLDQTLYEVLLSNPNQPLKCPFCKKEFYLEMSEAPRPLGEAFRIR